MAYAPKRRLRFFGKRKKTLAFIANVKNLRGRTKLSVIFFAVLSKSVIWATAPVQGSPKSASCKRRTIGCELLLRIARKKMTLLCQGGSSIVLGWIRSVFDGAT